MKQDILRMALRLYSKDLRERLSFVVVEPTLRGYRTRIAQRNLFLALSAGGLGVDSCGIKYYVTNDQKLLARERLEKLVESAGPKNVLFDSIAAADDPCDQGVEWRQDSWCPWVTSKQRDVENAVLRIDQPVKYGQLRRDWVCGWLKAYAERGFRLIGTSCSAVWLC